VAVRGKGEKGRGKKETKALFGMADQSNKRMLREPPSPGKKEEEKEKRERALS